VVEDWMGREVETLEDLLRPGLTAVCVGITPSPVSVAAGHYYQGRVGQRFFDRLRQVGLLPDGSPGFEADVAFAAARKLACLFCDCSRAKRTTPTPSRR
jgi:TDG/mug DNA glycosylase family protein